MYLPTKEISLPLWSPSELVRESVSEICESQVEGDRQNICCEMPVFRLVPVPESDSDASTGKTFSCPVFQNSERSGDDNYIINLDIPTEEDPEKWILRGVSLLCQKPKER